jgi:hypothetical protein
MWWWSMALAALPSVDEPVRTAASAPDEAAVVVGLEDYAFLPDVPHARRDAAAVAAHLTQTRGLDPAKVRVLTSAGREQILAAVDAASEATGTVWVYVAGHGVAAPSDGARLVLGDDARADPVAFEARGIRLDELSKRAGAGGAEVVLWVDACFNGQGRAGQSVTGGTRLAVPDYVGVPPAGVLQWAAAEPGQLARPLDEAGHGAFTYLSLGALRGWADGARDGQRDGVVTAGEAQAWVGQRLRELGLADQQPVLGGDPERVLAEGVSEPAPSLQRGAAPIVTVPLNTTTVPIRRQVSLDAFDDDALAAAQTFGLQLPLRKTLLGRKDAADQRVSSRTYWTMVKATDRGRKGIRRRTAGVLTMVAGQGVMAVGLAAGFGSDSTELMVGGSLVGTAAFLTGIGLTTSGQMQAMSALEPRL